MKCSLDTYLCIVNSVMSNRHSNTKSRLKASVLLGAIRLTCLTTSARTGIKLWTIQIQNAILGHDVMREIVTKLIIVFTNLKALIVCIFNVSSNNSSMQTFTNLITNVIWTTWLTTDTVRAVSAESGTGWELKADLGFLVIGEVLAINLVSFTCDLTVSVTGLCAVGDGCRVLAFCRGFTYKAICDRENWNKNK